MRSLSRECRVSGMEAPETVKDGSDAIGRRKPGRAGYRADGGKIPPPLPDAVYAASCQQLISQTVGDERKDPRHFSQQCKTN